MLTIRRTSTLSIVTGPRGVRRPRLILRKSAWVTIRFAGALVYGGCRRVELLAEEAGVHRDRLDAAPAGPAAGRLGVVVGVLRHPREPDRRLLPEEVHHLGAPVDEGVAPDLRAPRRRRSSRGSAWRRHRGQVVGLARRTQGVVAGDPDPAAATARSSRRSRRSSRPAPCRGRWLPAASAAVMPAPPAPTTTTSTSCAAVQTSEGRRTGSVMAQNCNRFYVGRHALRPTYDATVAAALEAAERDQRPIPPLRETWPGLDVVDAYEIQLLNIRRRLERGCATCAATRSASPRGRCRR